MFIKIKLDHQWPACSSAGRFQLAARVGLFEWQVQAILSFVFWPLSWRHLATDCVKCWLGACALWTTACAPAQTRERLQVSWCESELRRTTVNCVHMRGEDERGKTTSDQDSKIASEQARGFKANHTVAGAIKPDAIYHLEPHAGSTVQTRSIIHRSRELDLLPQIG